jgi:hypothetical protein
MTVQGCSTCGSAYFFSEEEKQSLRLTFEKQLAALPNPPDEFVEVQYEGMREHGPFLLSLIDHEGCGHSVSDCNNRTSFCAWVTNQVFHLGWAGTDLFLDGISSNVFHVDDLLHPEYPSLVLKESKGLPDRLDKTQAKIAYNNVLQDYRNLSSMHRDPKCTQSLKNRVTPCPMTLLKRTDVIQGEEYSTIGHVAPFYNELYTTLINNPLTLDNPFRVTKRGGLCKEVIDCVAAFHENHFAICDLKLENIYSIDDDTIRIGDSGSFQKLGSATRSSQTRRYLFTQDCLKIQEVITGLSQCKRDDPKYKELLEIKHLLEKSMDILALAIVCYEIFTNVYPPFHCDGEGFSIHPGNLDRQLQQLTEFGAAFLFPLFTKMINSDWKLRPTIEAVVEEFDTLVF